MLVPGILAVLMVVHLAQGSPILPTPPPPPISKGFMLNEFIRHFEPAEYDRSALMTQHSRLRRDTNSAMAPLRLQISSYDRVFRMVLRPDNELFSEDVEFEGTRGPLQFDPARAYIGTLEDDDEAVVRGLVTSEGLFDGTVTTRLDEIYIEPVSRYNTSLPYHTVVYRAKDVVGPSTPQPCASQQLHDKGVVDWEFPLDGKGSSKERTRKPSSHHRRLETDNRVEAVDEEEGAAPRHRKSRWKRWMMDDNNNGSVRHVTKRAAIDPRKTTCMLYLQADHLFYHKYGSEEACIEVMTRHVQRVNSIYKSTDFNQDGKPDNISFMIKRIKVHSMEALKDPTYRFPLNYGVEKFLELFSEEDYDAFCLAYMFTYRDFEMGTLGLAWTGDLKNAGGVCEKNGHYRGSMKSLNTGIVTLLNYGKHVPPAVSHVTLAHEIGHNFGSPHDPELCTPGGEDGNFIMFARATSGDKKNNNKFSPCSLNSINPVLNAKARSPKGCFTEPQAAICGNGVVEQGEECDCGWEEDCRDECCYPQRRYAPPEEPPCKLTPHSTCSPSQGPCCTAKCELKFGDKCREDNGCRDSSYCDGRGPQCPPSINKPNKTICNEEFVCFMGECTGSICLAFGLESCQCIPGPSDSKTKACELCCKLPGDDQPCLSSFDWNSVPYDIPDLFSKPGTPCNDYNGYCDVFQKCREVDPSGPLATLRKLLLSDESIASFKRWVTEHWYAVLLIVFAVLFILVVSTKFLGKRPNTKLKSITIIHSSTTETVRLPPEGAETGAPGVTVHPAVRSKLPLKRKVREKKRVHNRHGKGKDIVTSNNNNNGVSATPSKSKSKSSQQMQSNEKKKKKKNVVAAAVIDEPKQDAVVPTIQQPQQQRKPKKTKVKKNVGTKKKKKEVIDYSGVQGNGDKSKLQGVTDSVVIATDPVGKVKNWLMNSQHPAIEPSLILPKSKSTPIGLTGSGGAAVVAKTRTNAARDSKTKSHSTGNLLQGHSSKDKVRLQVVYKPPFKFSFKLRNKGGSGPSGVQVTVDKSQHRRSLPAVATVDNASAGNRRNGRPRTAVLLGKGYQRDRVKRATGNSRQLKKGSTVVAATTAAAAMLQLPLSASNNEVEATGNKEDMMDIDSNVHTVPSDLEVLLSESEFLFSDA